jgi:enoyl-CoA hydratase/carnithine racemase
MPLLLRDRKGLVEILTLNRPEARNAINGALSRALVAAFKEIEADESCRAVVLTGAGDRAFCAGMDLKVLAAGEAEEVMGAEGGFGGIVRRQFPKPLIAAVNGPALAGGCEIVLACDIVIAVTCATFGIPEVKRGLIAGAGGLVRLPRWLSAPIAMELALTGDPISARRACELGLINKVVESDELLDEAIALAARISANSPTAVQSSKRVIVAGGELPAPELWAFNDAEVDEIVHSDDAREGVAAFVAKRPPRWSPQ